jgi:hypothetical protein
MKTRSVLIGSLVTVGAVGAGTALYVSLPPPEVEEVQPVVKAAVQETSVAPNIKLVLRMGLYDSVDMDGTFHLTFGKVPTAYTTTKRIKGPIHEHDWTVVIPRSDFFSKEIGGQLVLADGRKNTAAIEVTLPNGFESTNEPVGVQ